MSFFSELKRRNVFRVAAAYLVGGWLLIEVSATLEETLRLPEWADTLLAFFLILGFPFALFFSWAYEITPDGIKREKDVETSDEIRAQTANRLNWIVIVLLLLAVSLFVVERLVLEKDDGAPAVQTEAPAETSPVGDVAQSGEVETPATPEMSIAVLPFVNMSSDAEQEYFSDGLTEELLNLLAGVEQLKVAARTSSFYYKDKLEEIPLAEIARELEVAHILEGSVRKGGDRVRITAQLIKADDGFHLWSNTWDRTLDDIFAIQDEIAAAVTQELKVQLLGEAPSSTVIETESYELTLRGRFLIKRRLAGDLEAALQLLEQAVELDPDNAQAWVSLSPLYLWLFEPPRVEQALNAAERAIELDPLNPEAWARKAGAYFAWDKDEEFEEAWARARELGKDSLLVQSWLASQLIRDGDLQGGLEAQERIVALDPINNVSLTNYAAFLMLADDFDRAREVAEKVLMLTPDSPAGVRIIAEIELLEGRPEKARELLKKIPFEKLDVQTGSDSEDWWNAMIEYSLGNRESASDHLDRYIASYGMDQPLDVASVYAWSGDKEKAFEWLEMTLESYPGLSGEYLRAPWLNSLEEDPRWEELTSRWTSSKPIREF